MNNDAHKHQATRAGIYEEYRVINGKISWKSKDNAIWFLPKYNSWAIGSLEGIGEDIRGITSHSRTGNGSPYDVPIKKWSYWDDGWNDITRSGDVIIECVQGKICIKNISKTYA